MRVRFSPLGQMLDEMGEAGADFVKYEQRLLRKEARRAEEAQRRRETMAKKRHGPAAVCRGAAVLG